MEDEDCIACDGQGGHPETGRCSRCKGSGYEPAEMVRPPLEDDDPDEDELRLRLDDC